MYIYMCMCICIYVCICILYVHIYIYRYIHIYIYVNSDSWQEGGTLSLGSWTPSEPARNRFHRCAFYMFKRTQVTHTHIETPQYMHMHMHVYIYIRIHKHVSMCVYLVDCKKGGQYRQANGHLLNRLKVDFTGAVYVYIYIYI